MSVYKKLIIYIIFSIVIFLILWFSIAYFAQSRVKQFIRQLTLEEQLEFNYKDISIGGFPRNFYIKFKPVKIVYQAQKDDMHEIRLNEIKFVFSYLLKDFHLIIDPNIYYCYHRKQGG